MSPPCLSFSLSRSDGLVHVFETADICHSLLARGWPESREEDGATKVVWGRICIFMHLIEWGYSFSLYPQQQMWLYWEGIYRTIQSCLHQAQICPWKEPHRRQSPKKQIQKLLTYPKLLLSSAWVWTDHPPSDNRAASSPLSHEPPAILGDAVGEGMHPGLCVHCSVAAACACLGLQFCIHFFLRGSITQAIWPPSASVTHFPPRLNPPFTLLTSRC